MQINTLFSKLKLPKLSRKAWITLEELPKFCKKVIGITRSDYHAVSLNMLMSRISKLGKRSGPQFTFLYLKEVSRLTIRALGGNPEPKLLVKGVMVKRDHNGLPTIIPSKLRKYLLDLRGNASLIACIFSIISVYRVFPTKVKPTLETIIAPFEGITRTFDERVLKLALAEIVDIASFKVSPPTLIKLETAGPNAVKSAGGSSLDAVAFMEHPRTLYYYIQYLSLHKCYGPIVGVVFICIVSSPIYLGLRVGGGMKSLNMGKLSVVYDQAGKARIVAITNWGLQVALKPLHKSLFKVLKRIKQDGTFDQHAPLNLLIDAFDGKYHSFDLSAATDRLPIDLQRDILNLLSPELGTSGSKLLDFGGSWKGKELIRYSVGQPMGAYSSWAMLAITHHVVVRVAAHNVGLRNFEAYCILGDDVVIRNDAVADEYFRLMKSLGVSINLSKSVQSNDFAEFAKVWKGYGVNFTPIGPGLTLRLIRDKKYIAKYIIEAGKLGIFSHFSGALAYVKDLSSKRNFRSEIDNILGSSFGLNGFYLGGKRYIDEKSMMYCFSTRLNHLPTLNYRLGTVLRGLAFDDNREALEKLERNEVFFYQNWGRTFVTSHGSHRLLEALLKVIGPGFWIYATSFDESRVKIQEREDYLNKLPVSEESIGNLVDSIDALDLSSIDWSKRSLIKENSRKMRQIVNGMRAFEVESFYEKAILSKSLSSHFKEKVHYG